LNLILKKISTVIAIASISVFVVGAICFAAGARINTTKSIAVGLYWTSNESVEKGAYVMFCPPDDGVFNTARKRGYIAGGFCPGDYGYLMKRILAAKGDTVSVTDSGVFVDGALLPFSKPRLADLAGRPLPRFQIDHYTLGRSELLLMSDVSDTSFDGRYYGFIDRSQIQTVIRPVFTW